jgi:hypothetical protein
LVRGAFEEAAASFEDQSVVAARRMIFGEEPIGAVASDLGMTENAIRIAKSRLLARVRAILSDLGESVGPVANSFDGYRKVNHGADSS